jgi:protein-S-isoprenylcysteine O-methyltransferase Ste14
MFQTILAYVLIASFFAIEIFMRQGTSAKSLEATDSDKGSTRLIGASFGVAIVLPPLLDLIHMSQIASPIVSWLGLVMMLLGLGLRVWSMRILGAYYSRTLRVTDAQIIVTQGQYYVIRHPGYLGTLLVWVGSGLALANWIAAVVVAVLMLGVYSYRIRSEEAMLLSTFGERYQQYRQQTWKLLPFLY